ncbi:MAG: SDR family oxidoreductase [Solobacterium sp.]|nr:SDR family oxidoreductase [Solobacterium sp.]
MTKTALVTGASSGIGEAIAELLLEEGWEVYGIGRDFSGCDLKNHPKFICGQFDLLEEEALSSFLKQLPLSSLNLLVNNAASAWYGPHETISDSQIETMVRTNLELPMKLCARLLRPLRENHGTIINIASVTALETSTHGAVYGALKAGLLHFSRTLFEENRKAGLKVSVILPDMTDTDLYRNADFTADLAEGCSLSPQEVAETVRFILSQPEGTLVSELVIRPQYHRIKKKQKPE